MHRPDKHSGIPVKVAASHKGLGEIWIWLFPEPDYLENVGIPDLLAPLYVTESRTRPGGLDADSNQVSTTFRGICRAFQVLLECSLVGDSMICRQYGHGRGSVPRDNVVLRMIWQYSPDGCFLVLVGQN